MPRRIQFTAAGSLDLPFNRRQVEGAESDLSKFHGDNEFVVAIKDPIIGTWVQELLTAQLPSSNDGLIAHDGYPGTSTVDPC